MSNENVYGDSHVVEVENTNFVKNTNMMESEPGSPLSTALSAGAKVDKMKNKLVFKPKYKEKFTTPAAEAKKAARRERQGKKPKVKTIEKGHEQYSLTYGMMLGLRVSVGRQYTSSAAGEQQKTLRLEDFMHIEHLVFPPEGSSTTLPHKLGHTFKFKNYAPVVFHTLRTFFNIKPSDYLLSLAGNLRNTSGVSDESDTGQDIDKSSGERGKEDRNTEDPIAFFQREDGGIYSRRDGNIGKEIYYFGIIDILQQYNAKKYAETFIMPWIKNEKAATMSSVAPEEYANRFYEFLLNNTK
eukprot:g4057.t1